MRFPALTLIAVGLIAQLPSTGFACGNFAQLMQQSATLQSQFGDLSNPNCSSKPDESVVDSLISCFEATSGLPARSQSDSDLQLSGLYGVITQCYRSGLGQQDPGKKSFDYMKSSTQADPTYETAWISYGDTVAGMKADNFFMRKLIESSLGISIDDEVNRAIQGLEQLPQDSAVSAELQKLRSL